MAKLFVRDLAVTIAQKYKLPQQDVENFINQMFEVAMDGLNTDKITKMKGLGTFKIQAVKARESINVSTGERVLIDGHEKVSFTPDANMKEQINRPFSQFETVILNDGVEFSDKFTEQPDEDDFDEDMAEETTSVKSAVEAKPVIEEKPVVAEEPTVEEKPVAEKQLVVEESPVVKEKPVVEKKAESKKQEASKAEINPVQMVAETVARKPKNNWKTTILVAAICGLLCFALGYLCGSRQSAPASNEAIDTTAVIDSTMQAPAAPAVPAFDFEKVNSDPRLKYLAYDIVGIDTIVTLKEGQTLKSYSKATLGAEMEIYFQVLNGVDTMSAGGNLKVPKVKVRKRK